MHKFPFSKEKMFALLNNIPQFIDQTLLKYQASEKDYIDFVEKSSKYNFRSLVVPSAFVKLVAPISKLPVAGVAGFPYGFNSIDSKLKEIERIGRDGGKEVDVVANIGLIKSGNWDKVRNELRALINYAHEIGLGVKVIIETSVLSDNEITFVSKLIKELNGDFIKTNSGYGARGASLRDIIVIRSAIGYDIKVKASGGIRNAFDALMFLLIGADVIGTSSGMQIVEDVMKVKELIRKL